MRRFGTNLFVQKNNEAQFWGWNLLGHIDADLAGQHEMFPARPGTVHGKILALNLRSNLSWGDGQMAQRKAR